MTDIDSAFTQAVADVEELPERPDNASLLQLYALYKQATSGDVEGDRPGMMDFVGRAKYDAWEGLRGTSADNAKQSYVDLVEAGSIDIAISPQQVTIGSLLAHVRRGDVVKVHSLRRGAAEAMEAIAHGNESESKVVGRRIEEIQLPKGSAIVALVRDDQVIIAHHDTVIETDDHVIIFLTDRRRIENLETLFQVDVSFV